MIARNVLLTALVVPLLAACASTYDGRYRYAPSPAAARVHIDKAAGADARVLASVTGVRYAVQDEGLPAGVELALRVENSSDQPVRVDTDQLKLVSADLVEIPLVAWGPDDELVAPARQATRWQLYFGFPDGRSSGDFDLQGLNFKWALELRGKGVTGSHTFERDPVHWAYSRHPHYYGPGPFWPRVHLNFGYHYIH